MSWHSHTLSEGAILWPHGVSYHLGVSSNYNNCQRTIYADLPPCVMHATRSPTLILSTCSPRHSTMPTKSHPRMVGSGSTWRYNIFQSIGFKATASTLILASPDAGRGIGHCSTMAFPWPVWRRTERVGIMTSFWQQTDRDRNFLEWWLRL